MRQRTIAALHRGRITLIDSPVPEVEAGTVRVRVRTSLFSPGTEFGGWHRLENTADPGDTAPRPFGYANAGVVEAVGAGVTRFCNGDRVACMGPGALHTNLAVVPQNLCVALPDGVAFGDAAYGHLAATAVMLSAMGSQSSQAPPSIRYRSSASSMTLPASS